MQNWIAKVLKVYICLMDVDFVASVVGIIIIIIIATHLISPRLSLVVPSFCFAPPHSSNQKNIYVCYMTHILCYFQFWFSPLSSKIQTLASINPVYIYVLEIYNSISHLINPKLLKNCNIRSMSHECVVILECGAVLKKWLCVTVTSACYYCYFYYEQLLSLSFVFWSYKTIKFHVLLFLHYYLPHFILFHSSFFDNGK